MAIVLTKELLTTKAEEIAKTLVNNNKGDSGVTKTQIRKFYNDFLVLKSKADICCNSEDDFKNKILPLIFFSKAKLAYSYGRNQKNISKDFVQLLDSYIDKIETKADFNNFLKFYEALIGYSTYFFAEKSEERDSDNGANRQRNNDRWNGGTRR